MKKVKINMMNGTALEHPLITAFSGNGSSYIVLDNEANGTMGLPIILVSKLENNRLTMISDAEWVGVKDILRMIIGGNQVDYINVEDEIGADDAFYKQLTLPVASFDILKNNYKPEDSKVEPQTITQPEMFSSVGPMPDNNSQVESIETPAPVVETPAVAEMPMPEPAQVVAPVEEVAPSMPEVVEPNIAPVTPVANTPEPADIAPVMPSMPEEVPPVAGIEPIPEVIEEAPTVDLTADKEAFMKACENMFDALVSKLKK